MVNGMVIRFPELDPSNQVSHVETQIKGSSMYKSQLFERRLLRDALVTAAITISLVGAASAHRNDDANKKHFLRHAVKTERKELRRTIHELASVSHTERVRNPLVGIASVYSDQITANGEKMDPSAMTAAHLSLPFNTKVKVTNQNNGRSAVVRINDRGPYIAGRVIDLSPAAADAITLDGLAPVSLDVVHDDGTAVARVPATTSSDPTAVAPDTTLNP
jgi:rare lipoprotein A